MVYDDLDREVTYKVEVVYTERRQGTAEFTLSADRGADEERLRNAARDRFQLLIGNSDTTIERITIVKG